MDFGRTSADKTYTCRRLLFSSLEECEKQSLFYQGKLETMRCCVFLICHRPGRILGVLSFAPLIALNRLAIGGSCESI